MQARSILRGPSSSSLSAEPQGAAQTPLTVLTLQAAVVAERLGFDRDTALTLGQAVAGLSAYAKGVSLGIIEPMPDLVRERGERLAEGEQLHGDLLGRTVPVVRTPDGLRAVSKGKPGNPAQIEKYLASKFGARLGDAREAMRELWRQPMSRASYSGTEFRLYERFRPEVPQASPAGVRMASWTWRRCVRPASASRGRPDAVSRDRPQHPAIHVVGRTDAVGRLVRA